MRLYEELADWWPLLSDPADYAEEAAFYTAQLRRAARRELHTVLELGAGGGNNASHMKAHSRMTLVDVARGMLDVSRRLNPECEHVADDMRRVRLGRVFDAVFVHDAVSYMTTEQDLRAAIDTAAVHCAPGGAAVFAPDHLAETFRPSTDHGGRDGEGRSLRYLEWSWDPDPRDTTCITDYVYALRSTDRALRVVHDRHVEGIFSKDVWLGVLDAAGFEATAVLFDHSDVEPGSYVIFVATKV
jgi:SAM-dependent methyltransferase